MAVSDGSIQANRSIEVRYRDWLIREINRMSEEMLQEILQIYNSQITPLIVDSPASEINKKIEQVFKNWDSRLKGAAKRVSQRLYNASRAYYLAKFRKILTSRNLLTRELSIVMSSDTRRIIAAKNALIESNIDLITNIPVEYKQRVSFVVNQGITRGLDANYIKASLEQTAIITRNRAITIARDQTSKANSIIQHGKWSQLGIEEAVWNHSGLRRSPRKSHIKADGKKYSLAKGMSIDGELIFPGQLINCGCYGTPLIPADPSVMLRAAKNINKKV